MIHYHHGPLFSGWIICNFSQGEGEKDPDNGRYYYKIVFENERDQVTCPKCIEWMNEHVRPLY